MKLRIRLRKRTEKVEVAVEDTVESLKQKIISSFGVSSDSFQLSLNGKDAVDAADDAPVSTLGVVSGDLLKLITTEGTVSDSLQPSSSSDHSGGTLLPCDPPCETRGKVKVHQSQESPPVGSSTTNAQTAAGNYLGQEQKFMEVLDVEPLFIADSRRGRIPIRLRQIWEANRPQSSAEALALVLHALMLEAGLVLDSQDEVTDFSATLPPTWRECGCLRLSYRPNQVNHVCHLACVPMGSLAVVTGIVSRDKSSSYSLQLSSAEYVTEWETDLTLSNTAKLSRLFKDTVAHPMMNKIREICGLPPAHGLLMLAVEIQIKVMTYLDVRSILNLSEVCQSLRSLTQDETLWHHLCLRDRKVGRQSARTTSSWKDVYRRVYREGVERRRADEDWRRQAHFVPSFPGEYSRPFPGEYPRPFPGIRGGDYDMDPFAVYPPGMPRHGPSRPQGMRPRRDPIFPDSDLDPRPGPGRGLMDRTERGLRDGPPGGGRIGGFRGGGGFFM